MKIQKAAARLGIEKLRPEQVRAIDDALAEKDVLLVQPTGFGKSACYQIPSMVLPKPTVLVSPLLALLSDQQSKMEQAGVDYVRVDGTIRGKARRRAYGRILQGGPLLVMTTPETLRTYGLSEALRYTGVSLAAIDEAHCISEWGYDFRPAYLELGERLRAIGARSLMALTATAMPGVREDITRFLGLRDPSIVASSPDRKNLAFDVIDAQETARINAMIRLMRKLRKPGIIYCATTRRVDELYVVLRKIGMDVGRYHGKMSKSEREKEQTRFMEPGRRVIIATNAFGLGIDKSNIRYVMHAQAPASLEQYVQEAGRAGRDGKNAHCILLYSSEDRPIHEMLLAKSRLRPERLSQLGAALEAWANEGRAPAMEALAISADMGPRATAAMVAVAEEAGYVKRDGDTIHVLGDPMTIKQRMQSLAVRFENLRTEDARRLDAVAGYARNRGCRAMFLRDYFGEDPGEPCGLCEICKNRGERPRDFFDPIARRQKKTKKKKRRRKRRRKRKRGGGQGEATSAPSAPSSSASS